MMIEAEYRIIIRELMTKESSGKCHVTHSKAGLQCRPDLVFQQRPWFSAGEGDLTPGEADRVLKRGERGLPRYERTMYLVFSLLPAERVRLGGEEPLYEAMLEGTKAAMRVFAEEIKAQELVWVASARADYPNPCVKVLINRQIGVTYRRQAQYQMTLPRRLRSHWAKQEQEGDPRHLAPGLCGEAFLSVLNAALTRESNGSIR